jgi:hypothetical protein
MPKKELSEQSEPSFCLHQYQLDKLHEFAYGLEGLANITKREEHSNIGYLIDIICNGILDPSEEIRQQKLDSIGGVKCEAS